jgi:hypothetical protein
MSETLDENSRRMMFVKGFGTGAKMNSIQYPASIDYMAGWNAGTEALRDAVKTYCDANGLPRANILRQEAPVEKLIETAAEAVEQIDADELERRGEGTK